MPTTTEFYAAHEVIMPTDEGNRATFVPHFEHRPTIEEAREDAKRLYLNEVVGNANATGRVAIFKHEIAFSNDLVENLDLTSSE